MKFVICVIVGKQIYFRGRMEIELGSSLSYTLARFLLFA